MRKQVSTNRLKVRGQKKIFHANRNYKKAEIAIFISDKIDFKTKPISKHKERVLYNIKGMHIRRGFNTY